MVLLYYYYAGWVDATVLSRCSGNGGWEDVGRGGRGLCYGCDGWAKREALHNKRDAGHGMASSRDSTSAGAGEGGKVLTIKVGLVAP